MSTNATLSVLGLYNYDNTIFDNFRVPEGVDKEVLTRNILMESAELEVLYTNPDFIKYAIGVWSAKEVDRWSEINNILSTSIDINNEYDYENKKTFNTSRDKTGNDTTGVSGSIIDSGSNNRTANLTTSESVSAYNSSGYENREKSELTGTDNYTNGNTRSFSNYETATTFNNAVKDTGTITETEKGHKRPIAELIKEALDIETAYDNIYNIIIDSFIRRFCLLVY